MDIEQHTWVIVETLNEGEEGEKVIVRRIAFDDTDAAFSIAADEIHVDVYRSPGDAPTILLEGTTRS